jgi:hypothetical protein
MNDYIWVAFLDLGNEIFSRFANFEELANDWEVPLGGQALVIHLLQEIPYGAL